MKSSAVKLILRTFVALVALTAVGSTCLVGYLWHRVRDFDRRYHTDVLAGALTNGAPAKVAAKSPVRVPPAAAKPPPSAEKADTNHSARVENIYFGDDEENPAICIRLTRKPQLKDILRHISVSPAVDNLSACVESDWNWWWNPRNQYIVKLQSADFKFGTPYVVAVRPTLSFGEGWQLSREVRRKVERRDLRPSVAFADAGRYLPSVGDRAVRVKTTNVGKLHCTLRRVVQENIVQLLAREERQYDGYWRNISADSAYTEELSATPVEWDLETSNRVNQAEITSIALPHVEDNALTNGVYLLALANGDVKRPEDRHYTHRLVCLTDLGLSVREDSYEVRAWVTSLTTGRPVAGAKVIVYASSRVVLAQGVTDPGGAVTLSGWDSRYEPFAVVAAKADGSDTSFMALSSAMTIDESMPCGERPRYLEEDETTAFVWTERGIYRHGEKVMMHAILRDRAGNAPKPFPVHVTFENPDGRVLQERTVVADAYGALCVQDFFAPSEQPSGKWKIKVSTPGKGGCLLGKREVKIEEFVPPQIRVTLKNLPGPTAPVSNLVYRVAAEHLFGAPAKRLSAESIVAFQDAEFCPAGWKGFRFGDERRGLKPNYTRLAPRFTDDRGETEFAIGLKDEWNEPKAAVRLIVQGSVLETGGRPSVTRGTCVVHRYPYYLGSDIPRYIRQAPGTRAFKVVQVNPDGTPNRTPRKLSAKLEKVERVYNLVRRDSGYQWDSETVRKPVMIATEVSVGADGTGTVELPVAGSGDYVLHLEDPQTGVSHGVSFWVSAGGDDEIRASLKDPTAVAISADKALYHEGERPRLTLKAPFRGSAWLAVMRDRTLYTRTFELTNLTSVVELDPLDAALAPNVDVAVSVVQSVAAGKNHLAARAHGIIPLRLRTRDSELPVEIATDVRCAENGGSTLSVKVVARGATQGEQAVITVVDEGINLLTNEPVPDPVGAFSILRDGWHPLRDLYARLLPVTDAGLKANGVKTGGDDLAGLMNRVSPVPTRRFKPLSQWKLSVPLTNGVAETTFALPEFVGEVRVTAFVYGRRATGCGAVRAKVRPKLVVQPDAPRFAAPLDRFGLTLALYNRSGKDAEIDYAVTATGAVEIVGSGAGRIKIAAGDSQVVSLSARALQACGQGVITYLTKGCGEQHRSVFELPVRPAVAWRETAEVVTLAPGASRTFSLAGTALPELAQRRFAVSASPAAELVSALDYLAEYPYGCLEQTTSRMFPLVYAGGILQRLPSERTSKAAELGDIVGAGVARVASMIRANDFVMWPDCTCPPWDREVSVYAAHFLVEASAAGYAVAPEAQAKVKALLKKWAYDADTNVSVYACHTLALAGASEKDRMFALYDRRDGLSLRSRARLARGFVRLGDPVRARALVADAALAPQDVTEAAFALLAILEMDAHDPRLPALVLYLQQHRDRSRFHWGTTGDNAHALLALAAYYRVRGLGDGNPDVRRKDVGHDVVLTNVGSDDAYISYACQTLPDPATVTNTHRVLRIARRFLTSEGFEVDLGAVTRGELLMAEITLESDCTRRFTDLVVQDLLPAGLEPDRREVAEVFRRCHGSGDSDWVLRSDTRDDRVTVFSRPVTIVRDETDDRKKKRFYYAVRAVTAGDFILPGVRVEAMYSPEIRAETAPTHLHINP